MSKLKNYWVSWYGNNGVFELHSPWWISGIRCSDDLYTFCAAVQAEDENSAKNVITDSHDNKDVDLEWRFIEERSDDWSPFCERFPKAKWMKWKVLRRKNAKKKQDNFE